MNKDKMNDDRKEAGKYLSLLLRIGTMMMSSILLFFAIGLWLIKTLNLPGIILVVFVFLGVACGFYLMVKEINKVS